MDELLSTGWIKLSYRKYAHPLLFSKKYQVTVRMCVDFKTLNTITNRYPIPYIDDLINRLNVSKVFYKIKLGVGYYQVEIEDLDE